MAKQQGRPGSTIGAACQRRWPTILWGPGAESIRQPSVHTLHASRRRADRRRAPLVCSTAGDRNPFKRVPLIRWRMRSIRQTADRVLTLTLALVRARSARAVAAGRAACSCRHALTAAGSACRAAPQVPASTTSSGATPGGHAFSRSSATRPRPFTCPTSTNFSRRRAMRHLRCVHVPGCNAPMHACGHASDVISVCCRIQP